MNTTLYVRAEARTFAAIAALGVFVFATLPLARGEEIMGCPSLSLEYKTSWGFEWKQGIYELEQTAPPLWKVYQQNDYTRVFTYNSTYYNGNYHETISRDEDASYRTTYYPDGSADHDVKTGGTVSSTLHRWTDDSSLNEQKALDFSDEIAWPWQWGSLSYNYNYGYWPGFFLDPPGFTPSSSYDSDTANTTHHEETGGFSTNGFSVTWDYTRDETYSDLYTTPEFLEYARTVLADEPYYPGGDEWDTSEPWEAWIAYRDLDSSETFLDWGAGLYRMAFTGTAGVAYELKWIERFIPDDDGPAVDSVITEWVLATGRPQHTSIHYVDPPSANGHVVIVLPKVACAECAPGTDTIRNGSVDFSISLGRSKSGDSAGRLYLYEPAPTNTLAAPANLRRELLRDASTFGGNPYLGSLVVAPEVIAATNVLGDQAYEIQLYHPVDFPGLSSAPTNAPFATWKIENPDTTGTNFNQLNIIKTADGTTVTNQYAWSDEDLGWTLTTGGGLRWESKVVTTDIGTGDDIETTTIKNQNGQTVYVERRRYHTLDAPLGRVLIERTADPDGVARTSSYQYFTNVVSDGVNYGKLKQIVNDDGSWTRTDYSTNGSLMKEISGFGNAAPGAAENLCRVKEYDYTPVDAADDGSLDPTTPRTVIENLLGQEISRQYLIVLPGERREIQCVAPGAEPNDSGNLVTIIKSHTQGDERVLGKTRAVDFPNGTREANSYNFYDNPGSGLSFITNTVLRGAPDSGNATNVVSGTRTIIVTTGTGHSISTIAYDIESGIMIASEVYSNPDSFGRPQRVTHLDGTHTDTLYGCCGVDSVTARDGSVVTYEHNALKQLAAEHRFVSATNAITLLIERDPQGNALSTSRVGTDTTRTELSASSFNLAGEIISLTNALGHPTTFTNYFDGSGQRVSQATYTDESARVVVLYRDGRLQSRTGTAESKPARYEYGIETEGGIQRRYTKEIKLDANGSDTGEWTKTYTDGAGREFKVTHSGGAVATRFYNSYGQLARAVDPDDVTALHQYNARDKLEFSAVDLNANEEIDFAGTDRIAQTISDVVNDASLGDVFRSRTYVWNANGSAISNLLSTVAVSTDRLRQWNILWNDGVGVTNTRTIFYAGNGARHETNTAPDGSYTVSIFQNGLLQSFTRKDANNSQIERLEYGYDAHNRPNSVTDAGTGTTSFTFNNADQIASATTPASGTGQPAQTTTHDFDNMGRLWRTTLPDNTSVTNEFYLTGDLQRTYGSRTYPAGYGYDSQGRIKTMTNWSHFATGTGARVTTWNYHPTTGFLTNKVYDGGTNGPAYTWTPSAKVETRKWARGISTTNTYNNAGDLRTVTYSDGTPAIAYGYDRRGRITTVTNGSAICAFSYNDAGQLVSESWSGGPLAGLSVSNAYDSLLRRTAVALNADPSALSQFGYDAASRLKTVTNGSHTASYDYQPNSSLVQAITFQQNGTTRLTTTKSYDNLNRLTAITSSSSSFSSSFRYAYNNANQRTAVTNADNSRWLFDHDALGQLISGKKYWSDSTAVAGQQFEYEFDDIGNRTEVGRDSRQAAYTANHLNQITNREVSGYVNILSSAHTNATVTTWGASNLYSRATRKNGYFRSEIPLNNSNAPVWITLTNLAVLNNGTNADIITTNIGDIYLAQTPERFTYDADGNLSSDGRWTNTWSAENRLLSQTSLATAPNGSKFKVNYTYDYAGRMVQRIVSTNDGTQYVASQTNRFIYDGNVQLAELDSTNGLVNFYVRGLDMSGTIQGAGGIGGLLAINAGVNGTHFYANDGNGNVAALVNANDGIVSAQYIYAPFGELLRASGPMASVNTLGFSSQYTDYITRRVLYRFRSYDPSRGTWDSRDPIGELGGLNLYQFVYNSPLNFVDPFGLDSYTAYTMPLRTAPLGVGGYVDPFGNWSPTFCLSCHGNTPTARFYKEQSVLANMLDYKVLAYEQALAAGLTLGFGTIAEEMAAARQASRCRTITVLGSKRDVGPYADRPGFNVLNMDDLPPSEWPRENALWLNKAIQRGDDIWLVTDPAAHQAFLNKLPNQPQSYYLNLELPMLNHYSGVNAIPKYATSPVP